MGFSESHLGTQKNNNVSTIYDKMNRCVYTRKKYNTAENI